MPFMCQVLFLATYNVALPVYRFSGSLGHIAARLTTEDRCKDWNIELEMWPAFSMNCGCVTFAWYSGQTAKSSPMSKTSEDAHFQMEVPFLSQ